MSFETITITHSYPVINGFVQLPNNLEENRSKVTIAEAIADGASLNRLDPQAGGHSAAGGRHGSFEFISTDPINLASESGAYDPQSESLKALV